MMFCMVFGLKAMSTDTIRGNVSFMNAQHVYVRFQNTDAIQEGDTIYTLNFSGKPVPTMVISKKSSISGVCTMLSGMTVQKDLSVFVLGQKPVAEEKAKEEISPKDMLNEMSMKKSSEGVAVNDLLIKEKNLLASLTDNISGRLSVSSYTNLSSQLNNYQRMKYNLSLMTGKSAKGQITTDSYLSYNQRISERSSFTHDVKIYSLSASYHIDDNISITAGRKLNPGMANIGAVDGLQMERKDGNWAYGALIGSRPDIYTYGLNLNLMQFGAYGSFKLNKDQWNMQSTVAIFNQMNRWNTDRRFLYFQHNQQFSEQLSFFGSMEMDLYSLENGVPKTSFNLTGMYMSLRYKPMQQLTFNLNYDARKNIYYYETYKNYIDSLYDRETRQGFRFQVMWRPAKKIIWNSYAGYRMANSVDQPSMNGSTSLTYNGLPWIGGEFTARLTALKTRYLQGYIASGEFEHDIFNSISLNVNYQFVHYDMNNSGTKLLQHVFEAGLYWRIHKKWIVSLDDEISLERNLTLNNRLFVNLTRRF